MTKILNSQCNVYTSGHIYNKVKKNKFNNIMNVQINFK